MTETHLKARSPHAGLEYTRPAASLGFTTMLILGLSSFKRNPAAVLLRDGVVIAGIENDKLARSATSGIPELAIEYCLQSGQIQGGADLDALTVATRPTRAWLRRSRVRARFLPIAPLSSGYYQVREAERLARELNNFRILRLKVGGRKLRPIDHQLCHAAASFFDSPFERALIVILDEEGDGRSGLIALGERNRIRVFPVLSIFPTRRRGSSRWSPISSVSLPTSKNTRRSG